MEAERALLARAGLAVTTVDFENSSNALRAGAQLLASPWNLGSVNRVVKAVENSSPQVAHIHNTWFAGSPAIVRALSARGVPMIVTLHNYRPTCIAATLTRNGEICQLCVGNAGSSGVRYRCYRGSYLASALATTTNLTARHLAWRGVDRYATLTEFARDLFVRAGLEPDRIHVLPNFTTDPGHRPAPPSAADTILFVGRLAPEKGLDVFAEAWAQSGSRFRFHAIGDGPLLSELKDRHPAVEFLGRLPAAEVTQHLLRARALVLPSQWYEGQSLVLLEAMAAGLPVLASDWPPIRATLPDLGSQWFRQPARVADWVEGIRLLESAEEVDAAGAIARRRYLEVHTPQLALQRLTTLYEALRTSA